MPELSRPLRWATALGTVIVAVTVVVTFLARPDAAARMGDSVTTSFGSLAVTRVETGFVPTTQGVPTMRKMQGLSGTGQLRVWVSIVNDAHGSPTHLAPDQFRLGGGDGAGTPDGTTLPTGRLLPGSSVDGQLWFDLADAPSADDDTSSRWLEYTEPSGKTIHIALRVAAAPEPEDHHAH